LSTKTVLPRTVAGRSTALAALALVLAIVPSLVVAYQIFLPTTPAAERWFWTGVLAAWFLPPLIGVLLHGRREQRWACLVGTVVTLLPTLLLVVYGSFYMLPAVFALGLVVTVPDRRIFFKGSSWLTKIGRIVFALVCVYVGLSIVIEVVVRLFLTPSP